MKWKSFVLVVSVLLPFVLLPLALSAYKEFQCAFIVLIVISYWLLEPAPMAAVSMLPVVLFPLFGIISSTEVSKNYMKESYMTFIGSVMAAIAVEDCNLHERIALKTLLLVGTKIKELLLGFMLSATFLSMWMPNVASTALMIPIVDAVVAEISSKSDEIHLDIDNLVKDNKEAHTLEDDGTTNNNFKDTFSSRQDKFGALKVTLLLCVCYGSNIGGTGTLIGTAPHYAFLTMLEKLFPGCDEITFSSWMMYNVPGLFLCAFFAWFYLWLVNIYFSKMNYNDESKDKFYEIISKRYKRLGTISSHEVSVIFLFSLLIFLWMFRDPKFIPGWSTALGLQSNVGDSTVAVAIVFLMFFLPSNFRDPNSRPILEWKTAAAKFPWGVLLLFGAGSSLAQGAQVTGLSDMLASKLTALRSLSPGLIAAITCFSTAAITSFVPNMTVIFILLPIFSEMALTVGVNPLYLMLPTTVATSYAFMLPISTVPNAMVYEDSNMKKMDMMKPGIFMNIVCCCVQLVTLHTLGIALFDLNKFPSWADNKSPTNHDQMTVNLTQILSTTVNL